MSGVPEELASMSVSDMMKVVAMILSGCIISFMPTSKKVRDFLPMEFTIHEGDVLNALILLTQLGFTVKGSETREFNPLFSLTVH
jgi:hypothetical protein